MGWHRVPLWRKGRRGKSMEENIVSSVKTTEAADGARLEQIAPEKPPVSGGRKAGLIVGIVVGVLALAYIAACAAVQFLYNDTALPLSLIHISRIRSCTASSTSAPRQ